MLILASASPRRQELLRAAGISFTVDPADIDEATIAGESARECAERLAREKASVVAKRHPHGYVLGADTVVAVDGEILGKPRDVEDAVRMLRMLSARAHEVITGVCVIGPGAQADVRSATTRVTMREIGEQEMRDYIAGGEPMDKAGAYAIQGGAARWITQVDGDYDNVVGLPVGLVKSVLRGLGVL